MSVVKSSLRRHLGTNQRLVLDRYIKKFHSEACGEGVIEYTNVKTGCVMIDIVLGNRSYTLFDGSIGDISKERRDILMNLIEQY